MPTARIEIEFVNKQWVIQVEASSIMRADRKTVYADTVESALDAALVAYNDLAIKIAPKDDGKTRELSPELAAAVARLKPSEPYTQSYQGEIIAPTPIRNDLDAEGINDPELSGEPAEQSEYMTTAEIAEGLVDALAADGLSSDDVSGVRKMSMDETREQFPDAKDGEVIETFPEAPTVPKPLRGRHAKACLCDKCVAKRAA